MLWLRAAGAHLLACVTQGQGQLGGDGALPDSPLSREDEDDVPDASQVSGLCSEGCVSEEALHTDALRCSLTGHRAPPVS